jgi:hypothetical protein
VPGKVFEIFLFDCGYIAEIMLGLKAKNHGKNGHTLGKKMPLF